MQKKLYAALTVLVLCAACPYAQAFDLSSIGTTGQSGFIGRLGLGVDWNQYWLQSSSGHLTGYWDTGLTHWEAGQRASARVALSFAPVFVYEFSSSGDAIPFIEAGIGVALFSGSQVGIALLDRLSISKIAWALV